MGSDRAGFLSQVAERANVPHEDAADLVDEVLRELARILDPESWRKVREIVPFEVDVESSGDGQSLSMERFLVELSGEEPVQEERAARHARAVAGAIRDAASESQIEQLSHLIEDDSVLALFEERRGELTTVPEPSDGEIAQHTRPEADDEQSPPAQ